MGDVAIVDSLPYGGTCALRGCDPKKILRRGAEIIDSARLMSGVRHVSGMPCASTLSAGSLSWRHRGRRTTAERSRRDHGGCAWRCWWLPSLATGPEASEQPSLWPRLPWWKAEQRDGLFRYAIELLEWIERSRQAELKRMERLPKKQPLPICRRVAAPRTGRSPS